MVRATRHGNRLPDGRVTELRRREADRELTRSCLRSKDAPRVLFELLITVVSRFNLGCANVKGQHCVMVVFWKLFERIQQRIRGQHGERDCIAARCYRCSSLRTKCGHQETDA